VEFRTFADKSPAMTSKLGSLRGLSVALFFALGLSGCGGCGKTETEARDAQEPEVAKVPAPDDLVADVTVLTPDTTWRRVQTGIGGAIGLMPQSAGGVVASLAGLDLGVGGEIDGKSPVFVVLAGEPTDPAWAVAVKVVDKRRARDVLVDGETAKLSARDEAGMTLLSPKGGGEPRGGVALALDPSGYLVVAKDEATVKRLGPYAARTLARAPRPASEVHVELAPAAMSGKVRPFLERQWQAYAVDLLAADAKMREARGRAPDFGDPKAIVAIVDAFVQRRMATLASLTKATVDVDTGPEDVHVRVTAAGPERDGGVEAMTVGDVTPIFEVPQDAIFAVLSRSAPDERVADARDVEAAIVAALGARLPEPEAKKLHGAIDGFAKGRGDALTLFALGGADTKADKDKGVGKGLVLRTDARDGGLAPRAMGDMADLLRAPVFKEPFHLKQTLRSTGDAPGVGKCDVLDLSIEGRGKLSDTKLGLAWNAESGRLVAAVGDSPLDLLVRGTKPPRKLADDKVLATYVSALGKEVSFVFFAQPFLVDTSHPVAPSPAVVSWGKGAGAGERWARVDVSDRVLRELLKKQLGL
jgi:hypothetical protein